MTESTSQDKQGLYWGIFLLSFIAFVVMLKFADEWFWITMPFMLTYFCKALKVI